MRRMGVDLYAKGATQDKNAAAYRGHVTHVNGFGIRTAQRRPE